MSTSYYRIQDAGRDVAALLDPAQQTSLSYSTDTERHGVSVCDSIEALATYLAQSGVEFTAQSVVVEVTGPLSDDTDEDANLGALLVLPTAILSVEPMTARLADLIDAAYGTLYAA